MRKNKRKACFKGLSKAKEHLAFHNLTPDVSSRSAAVRLGCVYCNPNFYPMTVEF